MTRKTSYIILIVAAIVIIAGVLHYRRKKKIDEEELNDLDAFLGSKASSSSASGEETITSVLYSVKPQANYKVPTAEVKKFLAAKSDSVFSADHPEYISQVLSGKTKGMIKTLQNTLAGAPYGVDMETFINKVLSYDGYLKDTKTYDKILNEIKNAK